MNDITIYLENMSEAKQKKTHNIYSLYCVDIGFNFHVNFMTVVVYLAMQMATQDGFHQCTPSTDKTHIVQHEN